MDKKKKKKIKKLKKSQEKQDLQRFRAENLMIENYKLKIDPVIVNE